jgi:MinD-like ATPase involved in chromosome partitioning or flagellar assembly
MSSGRWHAPLEARGGPTIIAVGGAQPGVGKSIVACNLAASIAGLGRSVVVVDLDFQAPRQHGLFGVAPAETGLQAWLQRRRERRDELAPRTPVRNLRLLPCATALDTGTPEELRAAVLGELHDLDSEVVVVDLASASRDDLFDFFGERAFRLLVTSREPAALRATYAFLKGAAARAERSHGGEARTALAQFSGGLVGNGIDAPEHEETFHAFSRLVREHLGIPLPVVGCLRASERIVQSIVARQPLIVRRGIDDNVRELHHMAELIMSDDGAGARSCPLEGAPIDVSAPPLPAELSGYARKHTRYPVDWAATLELSSGVTAVRVRDVSESGAGVETATRLCVGDAGVLHFDQLRGHPGVPVTVKNLVSLSNRVGLAFEERGRIPARVVAAARAAAARPAS